MPLLTVYDLHDDHQRIRWMQEATMTTRDFGLVPTHGLFGSAGWWRNIETGNLPSFRQAGLITVVYDIGEGDHPEFSMVDESGIESNWKREVNQAEDDDLYIVGRRVELDYVHQRTRMDLRESRNRPDREMHPLRQDRRSAHAHLPFRPHQALLDRHLHRAIPRTAIALPTLQMFRLS